MLVGRFVFGVGGAKLHKLRLDEVAVGNEFEG
jgi:hypothetical protein